MLSSQDKAALYSDEGYGPYMSGAQSSGYDTTIEATGSPWLANLVGSMPGGFGGIAALLGAAAGIQNSRPQTYTRVKALDPRLDRYVYGTSPGDASSVLSNAQQLWQGNATGQNPTMQQGLLMQRTALTDPSLTAGNQQMRQLGAAFTGARTAGNPYSPGGGQQPLPMPMTGGLLGTSNGAQGLIARGRGLLG